VAPFGFYWFLFTYRLLALMRPYKREYLPCYVYIGRCLTLVIVFLIFCDRWIWSICSAFFYFALFILINRSGIFERYNVVAVRQIWVTQ